MSCNGCRVLRKGCSDDCVIRPCLEWINSPQSQANATIFLAKFYGRVGLVNLINTAPNHLRQAVFRSLLYEACGRIVNPIHGSAGLLWTGNWKECQSAVDSVLKDSATFITKKPPFPAAAQYEANSVSSRSHLSSGGVNGTVKLELSLGLGESSPLADPLIRPNPSNSLTIVRPIKEN